MKPIISHAKFVISLLHVNYFHDLLLQLK